MRFFRPVWVALRAAVLATAVFWAALFIVRNSGWEAPLDATEPLIFFVVFFSGMLVAPRR